MNTNKIISAVCDYYGVKKEDLTSKSRERKIANTRQVLSYLLHNNGMTFKEIGKLLQKDRTTIIYSCKAIEDLLQVDISMTKDIEEIENFITTL